MSRRFDEKILREGLQEHFTRYDEVDHDYIDYYRDWYSDEYLEYDYDLNNNDTLVEFYDRYVPHVGLRERSYYLYKKVDIESLYSLNKKRSMKIDKILNKDECRKNRLENYVNRDVHNR